MAAQEDDPLAAVLLGEVRLEGNSGQTVLEVVRLVLLEAPSWVVLLEGPSLALLLEVPSLAPLEVPSLALLEVPSLALLVPSWVGLLDIPAVGLLESPAAGLLAHPSGPCLEAVRLVLESLAVVAHALDGLLLYHPVGHAAERHCRLSRRPHCPWSLS